MISKEKRKVRKKRERYNKIKRKEYTKAYLKEKDERSKTPHSYPITRRVQVKDIIRSKDLRKSFGLFLATQLSIFILLIGSEYPEKNQAFSIISILIGLISIIVSIREINRRQSKDITREPVRPMVIIVTLFGILFTSVLLSTFTAKSGFVVDTQPNQQIINDTLTLFPIPMLFSVLIVAPIVEELIFRELLPFATGPSYLSFILSSVFFIIAHSPIGLIGWLTYGITTVGLLSARLVNNNVYTGIIIHLIWNLLSVII